ncbi:MAG TPA: TonB family protein [Thermoanaerobaculia bacterium]|nr:TonB family protein [Thermoanaerobaculia bacterium]HUM30803.1 TonB family protein [Thermoanaerobaculia bacterium]HXK69138.1 TonB family protein [Thermoanaerobaculia bacterium]
MEKLGNYVVFREADASPWGKLFRAFRVEGDQKTRVFLRLFPFALPEGLKFTRHLAVNDLLLIEKVDGKNVYVEEYMSAATIQVIIKRCVAEMFPLPQEHSLHILERVMAGFEEHKYALPHPHLAYLSYEGEIKGAAVPMGKILTQVQPESLYPYLSPQLLESKDWNPTDQVYASGAFFFEMLTGKSLPSSSVEEDRIRAITTIQGMDGQPIPRDLQMILLKALAHNPGERYPNLRDMREELGKLIYDGTYAPTTFNVAYFMHTLFREDINNEEKICREEDKADIKALFAPPKPVEPEPREAPAPPKVEFVEVPAKRSPLPFVLVAVLAVILITVGIVFKPWASKSEPEPEPAAATAPAEPSPELQAKLDEAERQIAQQEEELDKLRQTQQAEKNPEIEKKLKEKEAETQKTREALNKMKETVTGEAPPSSQEPVKAKAEPKPASQDSASSRPSSPPPQEPSVTTLKGQPGTESPQEETTPAVEENPAPVKEPEPAVPSVTKGQLVDIKDVDQAPIPLTTVRAEYPPLAVKRRVQGNVILKVLVNEEGQAVDFNAIRYPGGKLGLDKAAIEAVKQWTFSPALKEGIPVKTWTVVTIPFTL